MFIQATIDNDKETIKTLFSERYKAEILKGHRSIDEALDYINELSERLNSYGEFKELTSEAAVYQNDEKMRANVTVEVMSLIQVLAIQLN